MGALCASGCTCEPPGESGSTAVHSSNQGNESSQSKSPPGQTAQSRPCKLVNEGVGPNGTTEVRAEVVVGGLVVPWGILFLDAADDMLVTERGGAVRHVHGGKLLDEPVVSVEALGGGEGGLLDIVAHPQFEENRLFYLYMTEQTHKGTFNRVEQWELTGAKKKLGAKRVRTVVEKIPAARYHNGGRMRVGPADKLYIGTGDAREPKLAQDVGSLAGKLLRINLDGTIPKDNPFDGSPVYLTGLRNTQGFDWWPDETMVVTDHGPSGEMGRSGHDEVNVARKASDLGWPTIYGCEDQQGMLPPSLTWEQAVPPGGAAVYTGTAIEAWQGSVLVGTLGSRHLHRVVFEEGTPKVKHHETYFRGNPPKGLGRLRHVTMGPDRHLYVTTSNCDGRGTCPPGKDKIYRVVPKN